MVLPTPIYHATPHRVGLPPFVGLGFAFHSQARQFHPPNRVRLLRTGQPSSVAPHVSSQRRSYGRLPGRRALARGGSLHFILFLSPWLMYDCRRTSAQVSACALIGVGRAGSFPAPPPSEPCMRISRHTALQLVVLPARGLTDGCLGCGH